MAEQQDFFFQAVSALVALFKNNIFFQPKYWNVTSKYLEFLVTLFQGTKLSGSLSE